MSGDLKLFELFVRKRLEEWGREFYLGRDLAPIGHQSKNMLQVAVEHNGELPPPGTYYERNYVSDTGWETECFVVELYREHPKLAQTLRAFYAGWGRKGVERFELARLLSGEDFSRRTFFNRHDLAFCEIMRKYAAKTQQVACAA